ncbi:signal peptidase II [Oceanivirga salmonicida]|uniref:signal peptidase II n=1 Tax=Oceanivirga salmonicida TaxID=1769291 RepID=UPI00082F9349|nr:signal peptidase II [Oceanivirga salmonicida]
MEKLRKNILIILILVLIDQLTKIFINTFFNHISFRLLNNKLGFDVYLNKDYMSLFNLKLNLGLGIPTLIFFNLVSLCLVVTFYLYVLKSNALNSKIRVCMMVVIAAIICSIIDKIFWGGSLDFIVFFGYIIDIKDIYVNIGLALGYFLYIYVYVIMKRNLEQIKVLTLNGYIKFIKSIFKRL